MKLLFIGGTRFVGRAIAAEAMSRGHDVTVFHRGNTHLPGAGSIIGDRDTDLSGISTQKWDAVVDACAYRPHQVTSLLECLDGRLGTYVLISSVSAYSEDIAPDSSETACLAPIHDVVAAPETVPMTGETYGPLKVLCEQAALTHSPNTLIIRPTYVIGPDDYTMRFPAWVKKIANGGEVECPGPATNPMQYIDARDQAAFVIDLLEQGKKGAFHCAAPAITFEDMLTTINTALGSPATLTWIDAADAVGREAEFPLWSGPEPAAMLQMNPAAALAAGLRPRALAQTAQDTLAWLRRSPESNE